MACAVPVNVRDQLLQVQTEHMNILGLPATKFTTVIVGPTLQSCSVLANHIISSLTEANLIDTVIVPAGFGIDVRANQHPVFGTVNVTIVNDGNVHINLNQQHYNIIIDHKHLLNTEVLEVVNFSHVLPTRCHENVKKIYERHFYLSKPIRSLEAAEVRMRQIWDTNSYTLVNHRARSANNFLLPGPNVQVQNVQQC